MLGVRCSGLAYVGVFNILGSGWGYKRVIVGEAVEVVEVVDAVDVDDVLACLRGSLGILGILEAGTG